MAHKSFDIIPPYPKEEKPRRSHKAAKEKKKSKKNFLAIVFGLFLIMVTWFFIKSGNLTGLNGQSSRSETPANQPFELFDDHGSSTLIDQNVKVEITDTDNQDALVLKISNLLAQNGFTISKTDKSPQITNKTIIYYQSGKMAEAEEAQRILRDTLNPEVSQAVDLDKNFDLIIVLGK